MRKIEAYIQPAKLDAVTSALLGVGVGGMSICEVEGFGRQRGRQEPPAGADEVDFLPKILVTVVVPDGLLMRSVRAIVAAARTGRIGDGKIFVSVVEDAMRVRTGETGEEVL